MNNHTRQLETPFDADLLWSALVEIALAAERYVEGVTGVLVSDVSGGDFTRYLERSDGGELVERVEFAPLERKLQFTLIDHPVYAGSMEQRVLGEETASLAFRVAWRRRDGRPIAEDLDAMLDAAMRQAYGAAIRRLEAREGEQEPPAPPVSPV